MKLPSKNVILFNGAAGILMVAGVVGLIKSTLFPAGMERCTARYGISTVFEIGDENGVPLAPGALQGGLDSSEWGVLRNLKISKSAQAPKDLIMRIGLSRGADAPADDADFAGGLGFRWQPGYINEKKSACLSYDIFLPKGFEFRTGGLLPGLFGGAMQDDDATALSGFAARWRWDRSGRGGVRLEKGQLQRYTSDESQEMGNFRLPVGRWVNLQQEVSLNTPGAKDGVLRLWVDGDLVHEDVAVSYRKTGRAKFQGVYADTRYRVGLGVRARTRPKPQALRMSPFTLLWK